MPRLALVPVLVALAAAFPAAGAPARSSATPSLVYAKSNLPELLKATTRHIWTADADGSHARRLAKGDGPALSPDGRWIAFVRIDRATGAASVDLMPATGGQVRALWAVPQGTYYIPVAWSPDSSTIAISTWESPYSRLDVIDVATGRRTLVASGRYAGPEGYDFSPESRQFVYSWDSKTRPGVFVYDLGSGRTTRISSVESPGVAWGPSWIAYATPETASSRGAIWLVHGDGSDAHRLTWLRSAGDITPGWWSADGTRLLAYDAPRGNGRIFVVNLPSGHMDDVTGWVGDLYPQGLSRDGNTILAIRGCGDAGLFFGLLETISVGGDRSHVIARGPCGGSWDR